MAYKVLDVYRDLPRTNCGECGKGSCFAFASAVYLEGAEPALCPHLTPDRRAEMEVKLRGAGAEEGARRPPKAEQALAFLRRKMAETDLAEAARRCGGTYDPGPPEAIRVDFLGAPHRLTRQEVVAEAGPEPTVWVKIFLFLYATRATGAPAAGRWAAYRELPATVSKAKTFEGVVGRVAEAFSGRLGRLDAAARGLGGRRTEFGSAERAYELPALPRVRLLLLFWDRDEEFPARATLLVDRGVLDYLDQEALVFLAEAVVARLLGRDLAEVIP
ncbi:MAG: hypothetical protein Kow0092_01410 [Deferrisomatales bacterium]